MPGFIGKMPSPALLLQLRSYLWNEETIDMALILTEVCMQLQLLSACFDSVIQKRAINKMEIVMW